MAAEPGYALVDAGDGRRLERFGDRLVDRPAPAAAAPRRAPDPWDAADLRYDARAGWTGSVDALEPWTALLDDLTLELRPTEAGQVGLFPEHAALWPWLRARIAQRPDAQVLHLFAHTGATTLALARKGARVAHVDASRPAVAWARRNATLSGLDRAPVRWLVDDAASFAEREIRRERRYQGFVIDPPAFGHGPGRAWRLDDDLERLLRSCVRLADRSAFVLLTTHSVGWDDDRLADTLAAGGADGIEAGRLDLVAESGARLPLGAFARGIIGA